MKSKSLIAVLILLVAAGLIYYFGFHNKQETNSKIIMDNGQLKIEVLEEGTGRGAKNTDTVVVHYAGTLLDGTKFDSSLGREPFSFVLGAGRVISGWDQGILGMKVGEKRRLTIAPELAYGQSGAGNVIPPNATLIFEVQLLELK